MNATRRQIPAERKALYYAGMLLTAIGVLLFLSAFVTFLANFGDFKDFAERMKSMGLRAFGGMVLIGVGQAMMSIGTRGLAGSGVLIDPERARKDVEPWSRMGGGMVQDALSEVEVVHKLEERLSSKEPLVKVRCPKCQALNDEAARFCNQCAGPLVGPTEAPLA
jgi:hypothetical protein